VLHFNAATEGEKKLQLSLSPSLLFYPLSQPLSHSLSLFFLFLTLSFSLSIYISISHHFFHSFSVSLFPSCALSLSHHTHSLLSLVFNKARLKRNRVFRNFFTILFLLFSIAISLVVVVVAVKALSSKQPQQQQQQQLRKVSRFQFLFLNPLSYAVLKQEGGGGVKNGK
jgi:hypothetical protein